MCLKDYFFSIFSNFLPFFFASKEISRSFSLGFRRLAVSCRHHLDDRNHHAPLCAIVFLSGFKLYVNFFESFGSPFLQSLNSFFRNLSRVCRSRFSVLGVSFRIFRVFMVSGVFESVYVFVFSGFSNDGSLCLFVTLEVGFGNTRLYLCFFYRESVCVDMLYRVV